MFTVLLIHFFLICPITNFLLGVRSGMLWWSFPILLLWLTAFLVLLLLALLRLGEVDDVFLSLKSASLVWLALMYWIAGCRLAVSSIFLRSWFTVFRGYFWRTLKFVGFYSQTQTNPKLTNSNKSETLPPIVVFANGFRKFDRVHNVIVAYAKGSG